VICPFVKVIVKAPRMVGIIGADSRNKQPPFFLLFDNNGEAFNYLLRV